MSEASPYAGTTPAASLVEGPGTVTVVEGQVFAVSGRTGDMDPELPHGLFALDMRILSRWELRVNGHRPQLLAVESAEPFAATFASRSHAPEDRADSDLTVFRHRHVGAGMRERLVVTNHGLDTVALRVELGCDVDFASLFEVKEARTAEARPREVEVEAAAEGVVYRRTGGGAARQVSIRPSPPATEAQPGSVTWLVRLAPGECWTGCLEVALAVGGQEIEPRFRCHGDDDAAEPARRMQRWRATVPEVYSDDVTFDTVIRRSAEDLGALRIFDPEHPERAVLAAGAPWFMTVFGRDSLLTAWMTLIADPSLARGVLETLARFQGNAVDPAREEEPGRILHEMRFASAGGLALGGADIYYGTVDATPLFVMLLGELRRWEGSGDLVARLLPHADRALEWIETYGDRDGDGYVEYQRQNDSGLVNQGWKDSWDAVRHADGTPARPPIALCEVQGYVYAAYVARAHFAREAGDRATFERCVGRARELRRRFNEDFWMEEHGTFALALDADKRQVKVVSSNAGHCLWSGIADAERAAGVARQLVGPQMFSGWGIRTLSRASSAYNPVSYHNGSVWPHDNALCAAGLARYGYVAEAAQVIEAQLEVAAFHRGRLPELFAGFGRDELAVPAAYPSACSPQAWASASPLLWLRTLLRLDPWATRNKLWLEPRLLESLGFLDIRGIRVGSNLISVRVEDGRVEVEGADGLDVVLAARPPLSSLLDEAPAQL